MISDNDFIYHISPKGIYLERAKQIEGTNLFRFEYSDHKISFDEFGYLDETLTSQHPQHTQHPQHPQVLPSCLPANNETYQALILIYGVSTVPKLYPL